MFRVTTIRRTVAIGASHGLADARLARRAVGLVVAAALLFAAVLAADPARAALPSNCAQTGTTVTCTYSYTGAEQAFTVPADVTSVHVVAVGAAGATTVFGGAPGGRGAVVSGDLSVTPADTLYVEVGGTAVFDPARCYSFGPQVCVGGFNGGGSADFFGAGGGGASDVRTVTRTDTAGTLASRVLVAAGGGAGGDDEGACGRGGAGGDAGSSGADGLDCGLAGGTGGAAGTSMAGGAGGVPGGRPGGLGTGGAPTPAGPAAAACTAAAAAATTTLTGLPGTVLAVVAVGAGPNLVPPGATSALTTDPAQLTISYTLSASDLAAKLVSDSGGKGPGRALADKAAAIQTAVTAGNKASACAGITDYLGLVNAQTGKKLGRADAATLTGDANALRAALGGC